MGSRAHLLVWTLTSLASCRSSGSLDDEVGLLQEGSARAQRRLEPRRPPSGLEGLAAEEQPSQASVEVAEGVMAWSREGFGPGRELREALYDLNSMNFLKNVEKVCLMAPSDSHRDCGRKAAERLACPVLFRAATALIPMETLETELRKSQQASDTETWGNASIQAVNESVDLAEARSTSRVSAAPVTVSPCLQQRLGGQLLEVLGRFFASGPMIMAVARACRGRPANESEGTCAEEARKNLACRSVERAALSSAGPEPLAKQMAFILGTHPIVIAKNRFDILDDPCRTRRSAALAFLYKFLSGMLFMVVIFCCLGTFCCILYKF